MKQVISIATAVMIAATLSACAIYEASPGGHVTFMPGYDYSNGTSDEPGLAFNDVVSALLHWR